MSLINKMLRDLDARRGGEERAALPAAVTPLAIRPEPNRVLPLLLASGLVIASLAGGAAWYAAQTGLAEGPAALPTSAPRRAAPPPAAPATPGAAAPAAAAPAVPAAQDPVGAPSTASLGGIAAPSLRMDAELSAAPAAIAEPPRKEAAAPKPAERPIAGPAAQKPSATAGTKARPAPAEARIEKQVSLPSAMERAEIEYRRGTLAQRQGNADDAVSSYRAALASHAEHAAARQALAAMLINARRFDEAEELLRKGTELPMVRLASTLALARLKVERNQAGAALELLQKNAASGEHSAEYQGFAGALLNRAGRSAEAIERYQAATRLAPGEGRWWAGLGIALEAAGKAAEAREAYQKARSLPGLPADLAQHVEQRLR